MHGPHEPAEPTVHSARPSAVVHVPSRLRRVPGALVAAGALALGACLSASPPSRTSAGSPSPAVEIQAAEIPPYGTVLVDGRGRALYLLSSERGGVITCTDANGCTTVWPSVELPGSVKAPTAGPGVRASLLGTVRGEDGGRYVTYGSWPLYTYAGDTGPRQANGEGLTSFGGTWYLLDASGNPVTSTTAATATTAATTTTAGTTY